MKVVVKAGIAAVQLVRSVVGGKPNLGAIQQETASRNAVCVAPNHTRDIVLVRDIVRVIDMAQHDVSQLTATVRYPQGFDARAERHHFDPHSACAVERVDQLLILPSAKLRYSASC